MYRVELKGQIEELAFKQAPVPNVPCGVERKRRAKAFSRLSLVPNVPCGVESLFLTLEACKP